jgi:hypothetical protein
MEFVRDPVLFPFVYWIVHVLCFIWMVLPIIIIAIVYIINNQVLSEEFIIHYMSD